MTQSPRKRTEVGFTIVAVLLIVSVIATVSATYVKHVVVDQQHSVKTNSSMDLGEAVTSGLQFVKQSIASGRQTTDQVTVKSGDRKATLEVVDLPNHHARCELQSLDATGLGRTLLAEAGRVPFGRPSYSHTDELPRVWAETASSVLLDTSIPKTYVSGQTAIEDTELTGLIVIRNTSALFLRNVIVQGAIISEDVLVDAPFGDYDSNTTPMLLMDGSTRIDSSSILPGLAVCIPDGVCSSWTNDARIQVFGDVVAHTVTLNRPGTLRGNVAAVAPIELHADLDRPGYGRIPLEWSTALDMQDSWDNEFMAFLPRYTTVSALQPIREFWDVVEGVKSPTVVKEGGNIGVSLDGVDAVPVDYRAEDGRKVYTGRSGRAGMNASMEKIKAAESAAKSSVGSIQQTSAGGGAKVVSPP